MTKFTELEVHFTQPAFRTVKITRHTQLSFTGPTSALKM